MLFISADREHKEGYDLLVGTGFVLSSNDVILEA